MYAICKALRGFSKWILHSRTSAFSFLLTKEINLEKSENDYIIIKCPLQHKSTGDDSQVCYALNAHRAFKHDLAILLDPLQCKPLFL